MVASLTTKRQLGSEGWEKANLHEIHDRAQSHSGLFKKRI